MRNEIRFVCVTVVIYFNDERVNNLKTFVFIVFIFKKILLIFLVFHHYFKPKITLSVL